LPTVKLNKCIANKRSSAVISILLINKISKLQSSHYRNVSTDPWESTEHTLGTTAPDHAASKRFIRISKFVSAIREVPSP
jgi:hypothetical protein